MSQVYYCHLITHEMNGGQLQCQDHYGNWHNTKLIGLKGEFYDGNLKLWRKKPMPREVIEHRLSSGTLCCRSWGDYMSETPKECHKRQGGTLHRYVEDLDWKPEGRV